MGSLIAAVASYCDAKKNKGQWLLRIEDIDPPREIKGASTSIISNLSTLGFKHDQEILYQSQSLRQQAYQKAIEKLEQMSAIYYCSCSRKELKNVNLETHSCRNNIKIPQKSYSIKLKVPDQSISFTDKIQLMQNKNLQKDCGDVVIKRKDQLFSYQIAVVVDDNHQKITDIVRGVDLMSSTPWQIYLNSLLDFNQPNYAHIPVIVNKDQQKLSKQTFATAIDLNNPVMTLKKAWNYLYQNPIGDNITSIDDFWSEAINMWNIDKLSKITSIQQ